MTAIHPKERLTAKEAHAAVQKLIEEEGITLPGMHCGETLLPARSDSSRESESEEDSSDDEEEDEGENLW
ncbi:hypothetical protein HDV00_010466, partial [Rhizophlyctis rosea]